MAKVPQSAVPRCAWGGGLDTARHKAPSGGADPPPTPTPHTHHTIHIAPPPASLGFEQGAATQAYLAKKAEWREANSPQLGPAEESEPLFRQAGKQHAGLEA